MDFQNTRRSLFFRLDVNYIKYANCPAVRMDMLRLGERVVIQLQRFIKKYCESRNQKYNAREVWFRKEM